MDSENIESRQENPKRSVRDLVNTPFKKAMFIVQLLSYVLIVASPFLGAMIGKSLGLSTAKIAGLVLAIFIVGEVLFYGSLVFLGKEIVLLIRDKIKTWFKRKKK